ncbi:uncharacterized protein BJ171DRAFT_429385 [Polychytrium aggregatum]|uniref:uncharacterized protein n=1 Tax=Polychytrium aggregatum TaxID=110093 RepID=UPI0022FEF3F0|nr:uncharacterized protein BJ171DRAFT_429385 [Polychytrium aggregatum]KAI9193655.1 hypothetical protein BJ171DRAFT_429385 [Polychytrium aggregatum]
MTSVPVRIVIFVLVLGPTFFTFAWFWLYHNNVKFHPTVRVVDQADLGYLLLSLLPVAAITVINSLSDISIQAALHRCQALDLNHSLQNIWRPRFEVLKHLKKRYTILGNPWSVGDILIALFIFLLNLYLWSLPVVTGLLGPKTSDPMWLQVLGMFAHSALPGMWDAGLAIAFAIRENYIVKSVAGAEAGQFHTGIRFHIALGYISFFLISFHCLFFIVFYSVNGVFAASMFPWLSTLGYSNGTGFISWVAMIIMVATSIYKARRRNYRLFAWTHKLYVIFILFAASHMGIRCIYPVLSAIVLFIFDRLSAHLRTKRQAHALISQTTSESIVKVDIPILPGWKSTSRYAPGDWISIQVPSISSDWHPFSIASYNLDTPDRMTLFVRVHGRWTQALNDIVAVEDDVLVPVNVDGPFGSRRTSYLAFDNLMLVGAGTGIGALIPFMRHFVVAASPQAKIHLVWMAKKETDILVYWRLLSDLSNPNSSLFGRVKVHLHFTKQPPKAKTPVLQKKSEGILSPAPRMAATSSAATTRKSSHHSLKPRFRSPRSAQVILAVAVFGMAAVGFVFGRLIQPGFDMNTCTGTDAYLTQGLTHFVCFYWFNWAAEVLACVFALAGGRLVILYILSLVDDNLDAGIPISALNHIPESINWFSGRPDFAKILGDISTSSAARVLSKKRAAPIAVMGAGPEAMMRQLQHLVVTTEDAHWFRESWKV